MYQKWKPLAMTRPVRGHRKRLDLCSSILSAPAAVGRRRVPSSAAGIAQRGSLAPLSRASRCRLPFRDDAGRISHAPRHASSARTRTSADSGDMCSLSALGGLSA
ncbi:unnamed protein product [Lampetra planeri]